MLISCWSTKGGAGTTVVAAALAVLLARPAPARRRRRLAVVRPPGVVAADLTGDLPTALGHTGPPGGASPGLAGWLAAAPDVPADALGRIEEPVAGALALLRRGAGPLDPRAADLLVGVLNGDARPVVADCGRLPTGDDDGAAGSSTAAVATAFAAGAARSLLVLRPCFLALRRAVAAPVRPSGVVLVAEPGRSITATDVETALDVPVVARVRVNDAVARAVDAGLLTARIPKTLAQDLEHAA